MEDRNVVRVILEEIQLRPACEHGPMLLFQRSGEKSKRFFSCSAYRDRKLCAAYVAEDDWERKKSKNIVDVVKGDFEGRIGKLSNIRENILPKILRLDEHSRFYCTTCDVLFCEIDAHKMHKVISGITGSQLQFPSKILSPLENSKKEAQYHFCETTICAILSMLKQIEVSHLLCIGSPTVYENARQIDDCQRLMLDLDARFAQFYSPEEFLVYNMFNHHFFNGAHAESMFDRFLTAGEKVALVIDPPFGGKVEVISHTLKLIINRCRQLSGQDLAVFWIFPYFMEQQIVSALPDFQMLDYKIDYINHDQFQKGPKGRKHGSPVRIFTNVSLESLTLPESEGYKYCSICKRWTSGENRHCLQCDKCTSKDGRTYVHCIKCNLCVKPTWVHCQTCNRCALDDHPCELFANKPLDLKTKRIKLSICERKDTRRRNAK